MQIDRCVCLNLSFVELAAMQKREGLDFEALTEKSGAGRQCGLCQPYLAWMMATGKTKFFSLVENYPEGMVALPTVKGNR